MMLGNDRHTTDTADVAEGDGTTWDRPRAFLGSPQLVPSFFIYRPPPSLLSPLLHPPFSSLPLTFDHNGGH